VIGWFNTWIARIQPHERRAVALAFVGHLILYLSYYILRPVRDTAATVFGAGHLPDLFTATFVGSLLASPIYAAIASRVKLKHFLPGLFFFLVLNIVVFAVLMKTSPQSRWIAASYYVWFSIINLFVVSVYWSLMVDLFTPSQATRLFAIITFGAELGAIAGSWVTHLNAQHAQTHGLLLAAAGGFVIVIGFVHLLIREKERMRQLDQEVQTTSMDHGLSGNPFDGFTLLFKSSYITSQAAFALLMTWVNTIAYFLQTDFIAHAYSGLNRRTQAFADIDLMVNVGTLIALLGVRPLIQRLGVRAGLLCNPLIMIPAFIGVLLSPTLFTIQLIQVVRRIAQYAVARTSREICFTVVEQASRYRAKNVIDTVVFRFGDVSSAWVQAGLGAAGFGLGGAVALGIGASVLWTGVAAYVSRRYEIMRAEQQAPARAA